MSENQNTAHAGIDLCRITGQPCDCAGPCALEPGVARTAADSRGVARHRTAPEPGLSGTSCRSETASRGATTS